MARAKEIAASASRDYIDSGTDPSEAIAKFSEEMFSEPFLDLCANQTNHMIFQHVFSSRGKRTEYPVATADRVKQAMASKKTAEATSPVWDRDLDQPAYLARPEVHPFNNTKVAEPTYDWSVYNRPAAVDERYAIDRAVELEKHAEVALQMAFADTVGEFSKFIVKSAAAGEPLFDLTFNIAAHCEDKAAAALLTDTLVRNLHADKQISKRAFKEYDENFKTASLDFLENGYPVLRGGESIVLKINSLVGLSNRCDRQSDIKRLRYQVEDVMVPRESHEWLARDATANGQRIF